MPMFENLLVPFFRLCFGGGFLLVLNPFHSITYRAISDSAAIAVAEPHWDM